ncbi:LysR family transcriptional regulator [[Clostridium] polysaccharolyticum]|uniref:DNA-binding transcriptional regulator, LysR family n=1 Tax=[Clostridium] polysaccharolyticum TaxID=29364 RepID=A0A1I0ADA2_9FIRM|nr:LysR family transcriptional regulator [[Clostridium] polysaccharolyticum]SES91249.1 DNA-binding transcriptional regulator, LysR family [[Clostridium] polysaccharolyticum]
MTILQLKYVIAIASSSSMREAASKLYVSQPALSTTVRELEEELGIQIFQRTNKGIKLTQDGMEFLAYAKQAVSQYVIIEDRYIGLDRERKHFSVSMQHYVFAVHAFIETLKKFPYSKYTYAVHETKTDEVLGNVRDLKSEIGIISYSGNNEKVLKKLFREYQLQFYPLMKKDTYAYVWKEHPLAHLKEVSLEELSEYPCVSFDQNSQNEFYLSEEALGDYDFQKLIKSNDRATSAEIMAGLNGYSIGTGIMTDSVALTDGFVCVKLKEEDPLTIGYIVRKNHNLSEIGERYIEELNKYKEVEP